jgi:hypothetical protein
MEYARLQDGSPLNVTVVGAGNGGQAAATHLAPETSTGWLVDDEERRLFAEALAQHGLTGPEVGH